MLLAIRLIIVLLFLGSTVWFGFATYRDYSVLMMDAVEGDEPESKKKAAMETRAQMAVTGRDDESERSQPMDVPGIMDEEEELLRGIRSNNKVNTHYVRLIGNGIAFAVLLVVTGFGVAHQMGDFLRFDMGQKIDYVEEVTDDRELYEKAEYLILKGKHIDSVELLRKVLELDPNHFEAQLRIAEVYDKTLENYEFAAPEYEAALKHNFNPERWSWAAVRLCNIYSGKLGDPNRAIRLMRDLVEKHPGTGGAMKVGKRLAMVDAHRTGRG
jgi:hypothetical protein